MQGTMYLIQAIHSQSIQIIWDFLVSYYTAKVEH